MLDRVGIPNPDRRLKDYPHNLSGGMRQRVMIAMALLNSPELLIADEPTTALDVTVQAQIIDLLRDLQREFGTAIILITHDLGVVADMADDVVVMYGGRVVERGAIDDIYYRPEMPYTWGLLGSVPRMDAGRCDAPATDPRPAALADPAAQGLRVPPPMRRTTSSCPAIAATPSAPICSPSRRSTRCAATSSPPSDGRSRSSGCARALPPHGHRPRRPPGTCRRRTQEDDSDSRRRARHQRRCCAATTRCCGSTACRSTSRSAAAAPQAQGRRRQGGREHHVRRRPRRDARRGRRVRLRQVDRRPHRDEAARPHRRHASSSTAGTSPTSTRKEMVPLRREMQMIFQDPYSSLNPRHTVGSIISAPFKVQGVKPARGVQAEVQDLMARVGLNPEHFNRYPQRVLRRPAPAHRHRPGDRAAPEAHRLRRAGLGPRRVDPGAGRQPARGPAGRVPAGLHLHRPRPLGGAAHLRPDRRHVPRPDHGDRRRGDDLRVAARTPTPTR